jgi:hypothetical protein
MNRRLQSVEIDRIILDGLDVTPDRAERIRRLVAARLGAALAGKDLEYLSANGISHLAAPPLDSGAAQDDGALAGGIARSIARAVTGQKEGGG